MKGIEEVLQDDPPVSPKVTAPTVRCEVRETETGYVVEIPKVIGVEHATPCYNPSGGPPKDVFVKLHVDAPLEVELVGTVVRRKLRAKPLHANLFLRLT